MQAFLDESMRQGEGGVYVLAAAIVVVVQADRVRGELRGLLLPDQERLHWRDESPRRRLAILEHVATLDLMACVVSHELRSVRGQDRARALCLTALLWDLKEAGVAELVIESRQERNDRKDRQTIHQAKRTGSASSALQFSFARPKAEELLWLADVVAGAWTGGDPSHVELLSRIVVADRNVP